MSWQYSGPGENLIVKFEGMHHEAQDALENQNGYWNWSLCSSRPKISFFGHEWGPAWGDTGETRGEPPEVEIERKAMLFSHTLFGRWENGEWINESPSVIWWDLLEWPIDCWDFWIHWQVELNIPVKILGDIGTMPPLGSRFDGKIWQPYPASRSASWIIDPTFKLNMVTDPARPLQVSATLHLPDIGSESGTWTHEFSVETRVSEWFEIEFNPSVQDVFDDEPPYQTWREPWGKFAEYRVEFSGAASGPSFGQHLYRCAETPEQEVQYVLDDKKIELRADKYGFGGAPRFTFERLNHTVNYLGDVTYADGPSIRCLLEIPEEVPVWDSELEEWVYPNDHWTRFYSDEGVELRYLGKWTLASSRPLSGDYVSSHNRLFAICKSVDLRNEPGEGLRRWHGEIRVTSPAAIQQPQFDPVSERDIEWGDHRVLCFHSAEPTHILDTLTIRPTHSRRQVVTWTYRERGRWVLSSPDDWEFSEGPNGALNAKPLAAGAWMKIDYEQCRAETGRDTDYWLGCRFVEVGISSETTEDFIIEIAGRNYDVSVDRNVIDVLACREPKPTVHTQSLLPTFLPEQTDGDGNPNPPEVEDVPLDWGIYKPKTIKLSRMEVNKTYTLTGLALKAVTMPRVVILSEGQWVGWRPDEIRSPATEAPAFFYAGRGGTAAHRVDFWAHRIGYVVVDGVIAHEIIDVLFRYSYAPTPGWSMAEPGVRRNSGMYQCEQYYGFPHDDLPLVEILYTGTGPGYGWLNAYGTGGDLRFVPLAYLVGPKNSAAPTTVSSALQYYRVSLPTILGGWTCRYGKTFGGVGLVRIVDRTRNYQKRQIAVKWGCQGDYHSETTPAEAYLTWKQPSEQLTRTLSQYTHAYDRHTWVVSVKDGEGGTSEGECRNRGLYLLTIDSLSLAATADARATYCPRINRTYVAIKTSDRLLFRLYDDISSAYATRLGPEIVPESYDITIVKRRGRVQEVVVVYEEENVLRYIKSIDECRTWSTPVSICEGTKAAVAYNEHADIELVGYVNASKHPCARRRMGTADWSEEIVIDNNVEVDSISLIYISSARIGTWIAVITTTAKAVKRYTSKDEGRTWVE